MNNGSGSCLKCVELTKVYGMGRTKTLAVDHVSLEIHNKEIVSIVGESGSGKTTLAKLLLGLTEPTEGEIYFLGKKRDISTHKKRLEYWKNIQAIFQDPYSSFNIFRKIDDVLLDCINMRDGKNISREEKVHMMSEACRFVNMKFEELTNKYPFELSGGEQQRVAMARALAHNPILILADEPSGNLDSENARKLHQLFFDLRDQFKQTFIIVTHNEELATLSDRKVIIRDGIVIE